MSICRNKTTLVIIFFLTVSVILLYINPGMINPILSKLEIQKNTENKTVQKNTVENNFDLANSGEEKIKREYAVDRWQFIGDRSKLFSVYSAYFDERLETFESNICPYDFLCYGTVRIITLFPLHADRNKLYCNYKYSNGSIGEKNLITSMTVLDWWGYHRAYMLTCLMTQYIHEPLNPPEAVALTYEKEPSMAEPTVFTYIRYPSLLNPNVKPHPRLNEIAACVNDFHDSYSNTIRIVEFIELNKMLGVTKFYFYNNNISASVQKLFDYYLEHENVELLDWNLQVYHKIIWDHGLHACNNDCYNRASFVGNYKYVLLTDIDEFIIPFMKGVTTLPGLIKKLDTDERYNSLNVRHSFVSTNFEDEDKNSKYFKNKYLYTQNNLQRAFPLEHRATWLNMPRSKMIGKGKHIIKVDIHKAEISAKRRFERLVQMNDALLFHYREPQQTKNYPIRENAVLKYGNELRKKVDEVCGKVFDDGICPAPIVEQKTKKRIPTKKL